MEERSTALHVGGEGLLNGVRVYGEQLAHIERIRIILCAEALAGEDIGVRCLQLGLDDVTVRGSFYDAVDQRMR